MVNFFNTNDYVLASGKDGALIQKNWEAGQLQFKPWSAYNYSSDGTNGFRLIGAQTNLITNLHELMSFVALPRSKAVGAQPGVRGVISGNELDLRTAFGFDGERFDHSGQFTRSVQQATDFYLQLLERLDF
jgi:hypothetical protein